MTADPVDPARVRSLYDLAAAMPRANARRFLEEECLGQPELLAEVLSLVELAPEAEAFLDPPTVPLLHGLVAPASYGPYVVQRALGHGGHASVFHAVHRDTGASVALKTVRGTSPQLLDGIRREILTLARMEHPDVVRILDQGVSDGAPWYAMELVPGDTLRELLEQSSGDAPTLPADAPPAARAAATLERGRALAIVHALCDPLGHVHGKGVVHRDLKPSNIVVRPDGRPVIVDFGVASAFAAGLSREVVREEGAIVGTVLYMAPEQIRGELVDARADLYALGCILHELVAGAPPFLSSDAQVVMRKHLDDAPVPLSACAEGVPAALEALVRGLLEKDPRRRIGYAGDVAAVLEALGVAPPGYGARDARPYLYRPRHVGRGDALARLSRMVEAAARGSGGLALVSGESGIGKTRLALELSRLAVGAGLEVLTGECPPADGAGGPPALPLAPLRAPLRAIADRCHDARLTERILGDRGALLAPYEPALAALPAVASAPSPPQLSPEASRRRLYRALVETLQALSGVTPLMLILDDLHGADDLSLGFLEELLRSPLAAMPLLVVGTYRPEEAPDALRDLSRAGATSLRLTPLDDGDVGTLVGDMLALPDPDAELVSFLARACEGNPFFVAEYLRAAAEEGSLRRDGDRRWAFLPGSRGAGADPVGLPASLREAVARRLSGLPEAAHALLHAASVLGRADGAAVLLGIARLGETDGFPALEELLARHLLDEGSDGRLKVAHGKIREAAYAELPADTRRELHLRTARLLRARADVERDEGELGRHWELGGELPEARRAYLAGARGAAETHALAAAETLFRSFLALGTDGSEGDAAVRLELASVLRVRGRREEAIEELERVLRAARALGSPSLEAAAGRCLGALYLLTGRAADAERHFESAIDVGRAAGDATQVRLAMEQLAVLHQQQGSMERARALYEEALARHRAAGDLRNVGCALANLATLHHQQRRLDEAGRCYVAAREAAGTAGDARIEAEVLGNLGALELELGDLPHARALLEETIVAARKVSDRSMEMLARSNLGICHGLAGEEEAAVRCHTEALAMAVEVSDPGCESLNRLCLATLALDAGDWEQAATVCRSIGQDARLDRDRHVQGNVRVVRSMVERLGAGDLDAAERLADEAVALYAELGDRLEVARSLCQRGHVRLARGQDAAREIDEVAACIRELAVGPQSELARQLERLQRAAARARAGGPLLRGEDPEALPRSLRERLGG